MPLQAITTDEQRLDRLASDLRGAVEDSSDSLQHVFSSHLVLASAGHIEKSVINILSEYGRINGNPTIKRYVEKTVERNNSLNCEKISKILHLFDKDWAVYLNNATTAMEREAVDSLKTLRDQVAHGKRNGTGFTVVFGYFTHSKRFVRSVSHVILGY